MTEKQKQYKINYGCISLDDRLTSRQFENPEFMDTPQQVDEFFNRLKLDYSKMGVKPWAVNIQKWNGYEYVKVNRANELHIYVVN